MKYILTLEEGCEPLLTHALELAKDFEKEMDKYERRTAKTRRKPGTYMVRHASRADSEHWTMWVYHTTKGIHVGVRKSPH